MSTGSEMFVEPASRFAPILLFSSAVVAMSRSGDPGQDEPRQLRPSSRHSRSSRQTCGLTSSAIFADLPSSGPDRAPQIQDGGKGIDCVGVVVHHQKRNVAMAESEE